MSSKSTAGPSSLWCTSSVTAPISRFQSHPVSVLTSPSPAALIQSLRSRYCMNSSDAVDEKVFRLEVITLSEFVQTVKMTRAGKHSIGCKRPWPVLPTKRAGQGPVARPDQSHRRTSENAREKDRFHQRLLRSLARWPS